MKVVKPIDTKGALQTFEVEVKIMEIRKFKVFAEDLQQAKQLAVSASMADDCDNDDCFERGLYANGELVEKIEPFKGVFGVGREDVVENKPKNVVATIIEI